MSKTYDYIIAGGGLSGLSLLYRLISSDQLCQKNILVIDKERKSEDDKTWCYWEKDAGIFESIVSKKWNRLKIQSFDKLIDFQLSRYQYKMIRSKDLYDLVFKKADECANVEFRYEAIEKIEEENSVANVTTDQSKYSAFYIFNSTGLYYPKMSIKDTLLQHFMGWYIETDQSIFDPEIGTLMDFRVDQKRGITFFYNLPLSSNQALIEYTEFSPEVQDEAIYISGLDTYIREHLKIDHYNIKHKEFGVIPMTKLPFKRQFIHKNIVNIGTAAGWTKSSTGYTFQFVQKELDSIVGSLINKEHPSKNSTISDKANQWYDNTLLEVLIEGKLSGRDIFITLFEKNQPESVLAFLANESTIAENLGIMLSVPTWPFVKAGIKQF